MMALWERISSGFLKVAGYLVPLVQSVPPLGIWTGIMTIPFASFLVIMLANLPVNLPRALSRFFVPSLIPERALIIVGLSILVYSVVYLRIKREEGLTTSGPYRLVRHPQYLGMILSTLGFTGLSVWILNNTFGSGFLSSSQTIGVWFIELFAYILLAYIEESYLLRNYGESFEKYKSQVSFFIPFLKIKREDLNVLISISILTLLLFTLIGFQ